MVHIFTYPKLKNSDFLLSILTVSLTVKVFKINNFCIIYVKLEPYVDHWAVFVFCLDQWHIQWADSDAEGVQQHG